MKSVVAVAHPRQHAGSEVLDDDVGLLGDPVEDLLRFRRLEVDRERALVAVPGEEVGALRAADPAVVEGHGAEQVALSRPLDLDDVGAHVGEQLRRERPLQQVAEIEDGDVGEGFLGHGRRVPEWGGGLAMRPGPSPLPGGGERSSARPEAGRAGEVGAPAPRRSCRGRLRHPAPQRRAGGVAVDPGDVPAAEIGGVERRAVEGEVGGVGEEVRRRLLDIDLGVLPSGAMRSTRDGS